MYQSSEDLKHLAEVKPHAPAEFTAWVNLDGIVGRKDGKVPWKFRELIAVAVAHTTQCPYCIEVHSKAAKRAGASKEELAEAIFIAAAIRSSGAAAHSAMAMRFYDEA